MLRRSKRITVRFTTSEFSKYGVMIGKVGGEFNRPTNWTDLVHYALEQLFVEKQILALPPNQPPAQRRKRKPV